MQKTQPISQERLEEKDGVEGLVVPEDNTCFTVMDIASDTSVEMLDCTVEMPEDLSTKHRKVSVQTETCNQERFEQIFDGFSQYQMRYFMDILIHFDSKKDSGNSKREMEMFYQNVDQVTFIRIEIIKKSDSFRLQV